MKLYKEDSLVNKLSSFLDFVIFMVSVSLRYTNKCK